MLLENEVALITGASRGIGKAMATHFVREGAHVALLARRWPDADSIVPPIGGPKVLTFCCDVGRPHEVDTVVQKVLLEFGKIDVLVNNAGILGPIGLLAENNLDEWIETVKVNLLGTVICMRAVLPHMMSRRKGCIINLSGGGAVSPRPRFSAYGASKAAVVRLTESIAAEVREFQIRVNAIAPGAVNTRILEQILEAGDKAGREFSEAVQRQREGGVPPDSAAELAVFLASPAAAGITGRLISAVWDDWKSLPDRLNELADSALFTVRRIDGRTFKKTR